MNLTDRFKQIQNNINVPEDIKNLLKENFSEKELAELDSYASSPEGKINQKETEKIKQRKIIPDQIIAHKFKVALSDEETKLSLEEASKNRLEKEKEKTQNIIGVAAAHTMTKENLAQDLWGYDPEEKRHFENVFGFHSSSESNVGIREPIKTKLETKQENPETKKHLSRYDLINEE
jgi:hypothetical protein